MPTYQYACTECDHRFEAVQSFSDTALTACPECSGKLRKLYGAVGVVFKGSGFYRTDSRSSSAPKTEAPAAKKTETASATTPAAAAS
ncbi:FmdB family zinc ribbon protein [Actinosynnema sp. NPDC050801]|uniref:FmdB family zinc ribbon protein n=1 Tax=unclassified Actinosynnema TaxID=2637065 RepID=UPI0033E934A9